MTGLANVVLASVTGGVAYNPAVYLFPAESGKQELISVSKN